MQIKASLKPLKKGVLVVFEGIGAQVRVRREPLNLCVFGAAPGEAPEYFYNPSLMRMTRDSACLFKAGSAHITYDALIGSLVPLAGSLKTMGLDASDIFGILEAVASRRYAVRGEAECFITEIQMGRVRRMMGESIPAGNNAGFNFESILKDLK